MTPSQSELLKLRVAYQDLAQIYESIAAIIRVYGITSAFLLGALNCLMIAGWLETPNGGGRK